MATLFGNRTLAAVGGAMVSTNAEPHSNNDVARRALLSASVNKGVQRFENPTLRAYPAVPPAPIPPPSTDDTAVR